METGQALKPWERWDQVHSKSSGDTGTVIYVDPNGNAEICFDVAQGVQNKRIVLARMRKDFEIDGKVASGWADLVEKAWYGNQDVTDRVKYRLETNQSLVSPSAEFPDEENLVDPWSLLRYISGFEPKKLFIELKANGDKTDASNNLKQLLEVARSLAKRMENMDQAQPASSPPAVVTRAEDGILPFNDYYRSHILRSVIADPQEMRRLLRMAE